MPRQFLKSQFPKKRRNPWTIKRCLDYMNDIDPSGMATLPFPKQFKFSEIANWLEAEFRRRHPFDWQLYDRHRKPTSPIWSSIVQKGEWVDVAVPKSRS